MSETYYPEREDELYIVVKALIARIGTTESTIYLLQERVKVLEEAQATKKRFKKPTILELWTYASGLNPPYVEFDPEAFLAHYDSNGWMIGKSPMKDWKGCVRTWYRHEIERQRKAKIK